MRELTIEEKAKRFDEAIKIAKSKIKNDKDHVLYEDDVLEIFPELKESEDERIRKELICFLKTEIPQCNARDKYISLLEKQGEHTSVTDLRTWKYIADYVVTKWCGIGQYLDSPRLTTIAEELQKKYSLKQKHGEQKPTDKVEQKFKVGDWVVVDDGRTGRIIECTQDFADVDLEFSILSTRVNNIRSWTIQDAKDGDVLVASDDSIFLFKGTMGGACKHYVALTTDGVVKFNKGLEHYWETFTAVHPATKEQRDLLFQKMHEAGYEWDAEKLELKKVEKKPAWSEEDKNHVKSILSTIECCKVQFPNSQAVVEAYNADIEWLKSLRQILSNVERVGKNWKPSEEHIRYLQAVVNDANNAGAESCNHALKDLLEQLKAL